MMNSKDIFAVKDAKEIAKSKLSKMFIDFLEGGAGNETTVQENERALGRIQIIPRVMRDVSKQSMDTTIVGHKISMPIGISPVAGQLFCHSDGDKATAQACSSVSSIMVISTWSSFTSEEIIKACPALLCFQQIYITVPKTIVQDMVKRAEACNVKGLVVTVDQASYGNNLHVLRSGLVYPKTKRYYNKYVNNLHAAGYDMFATFFNKSQTWKDISWLKSITKLPVIVKGVLTKEDAIEALNHGVDAIWLSNHGGRQLDCAPATISVLPGIIEAVNGKCEVYIDGGFRTGTDVFKALSLGARAVFVGRPIMYGLACDGSNGVKRVLDILKNELDNTMALTGFRSLSEITVDRVLNTRSNL